MSFTPLFLTAALLAFTGLSHALCPPGVPIAFCLRDPCADDVCKTTRETSGLSSVTCQSNYCGGCNYKCCVPKEQLCNDHTECCDKEHVCAFTNACFVNPFTKCARICVPKKDAAENCKKRNAKCSPGKLQCCQGTTCLKTKSYGYRCQNCKGLGETCSSTRPCCDYLACTKAAGEKVKTCQPKALLG